jgi:hypothetical protein
VRRTLTARTLRRAVEVRLHLADGTLDADIEGKAAVAACIERELVSVPCRSQHLDRSLTHHRTSVRVRHSLRPLRHGQL